MEHPSKKQHQSTTTTRYNRYPNIFYTCTQLIKKQHIDILSFGCSTGEEIITLKNIYFPSANIYGVDINNQILTECAKKVNKKYLFTQEQFLLTKQTFDIIFAMSCLCKWEETESVEDSSELYPFHVFESGVKMLHNKLNTNGLLVIYNANYMFEDTCVAENYRKISRKCIKESGIVHKFDKHNKKMHNINHNGVIFRKLTKLYS